MANSEIVPFGKYRNKPVEALVQDNQYCEWLLTQDWFREKFGGIHTLVINQFGTPAETPEHNALQALFLDDKWAKAFVVAGLGGAEVVAQRFEQHRREAIRDLGADLKELKHNGYHAYTLGERLQIIPEGTSRFGDDKVMSLADLTIACERAIAAKVEAVKSLRWQGVLEIRHLTFEDRGTDISFDANRGWAGIGRWGDMRWRVECKPSLGDDYPAVLRKMGNRQENILLIGDGGYCGRGATLEQVTQIFARSNIRIVCVGEVDRAMESL